jgi:uncharacterized repeat protein (TIGR03987 family)
MFFPILLVTSACLLYTTAIWTEQFQGRLTGRIIALFVAGFTCDITGTLCMFIRARSRQAPAGIHGLSGSIALVIMLIHLIWALISLKHRTDRSAKHFNQFSPFAWCMWMIAFLTGIPPVNRQLWLVAAITLSLFTILRLLTNRKLRRSGLNMPE